MENKKTIIAVIGWYGMIAILVAYGLLSFALIGSKDLAYQLLNLTGALGIVIEAFHKKDYQPAVLNIIWVIIAIVALVTILIK